MNDNDPLPNRIEREPHLSEADGGEFGRDRAASSTMNGLYGELETLAELLSDPVVVDPVYAEAACARAVELASRVIETPRLEPSASAAISPADPVDPGYLGPYKLLALLGQGGMGKVYKALHPKLDKVVALKVLSTDRVGSSELLSRFEREMKAAGKLDHPHLIRALDAGEVDGTHYLVMEYVSGIDLALLIKHRRRLSMADACELIVQAASGLHAAHSHGMVHRDIKPANLMLSIQEFGLPIVKVLDLGLALLSSLSVEQSGLTTDGQIMGTIEYMAPEQASNCHSVDARADVYSLGATLYALLTGGSIFANRPYQTMLQKLSALANESVPSIRHRRPDIDGELADIIDRMLARSPDDRYQSMAAVIVALKPFTVGADLPTLLTGNRKQTNEFQLHETLLVASRTSTDGLLSTGDNWNKRGGAGRDEVDNACNRSTRLRQPRTVIALATVVAGIALFAAIIFSRRTADGDLVVEIPDDVPADVRKEIKISVTGDGVAEVASEANGWKIGVKEGKYNAELTGGSDQVQLDNSVVTVTRNKKTIVTITMQPAAKTAVSRSKPAGITISDPATERRLAEWVLGVKGHVTVRTSTGESVEVSRRKDLPKKPFTLTGVVLDSSGAADADDQISNDDCRQFAAISGLETLNLSRQQHVTTEGLAHFSGCRDLKFLGLGFTEVGVDAIPLVANFTKLESFQFPLAECDTWAEALTKMPTLRKVIAYRSGITDVGVAHLARLPRLEDLNLVDADLTDASLKSLTTCKSLKSLVFHCSKLTWPEVKRLQQALPECSIDDLRLSLYDPNYQFAQWLKSLPPPLMFEVSLGDGSVKRIEPTQPLPLEPLQVEYLFLQGPALDQPGDAFLDEFAMRVKGQRITGLQLRSPMLTSERVARVVKLPEFADLHKVSIVSDVVDDTAIEVLAGLPKLTHVNFHCPKLTGKGLQQLRELTSLAMLGTSGIPAEGIDELTQLSKLLYLQIGNVRFTDRQISSLAKLKLTNLLAVDAGIDDVLLAHLSRMESLEVLALDKSPITDAGLPELKKLTSLNYLSLVGTKVTAAGVADLQQALPKCKIEWDVPPP